MLAEAPVPSGLHASLLACSEPRVLLLRHADRYPIPTALTGDDVRLTHLGEARCISLRRALGRDPDHAVSSPLHRCTHTAELVGRSPRESAVLGAPGAFVTDPQVGGEVFARHGTETVLRGQLAGETWGCMRPLGEGASLVHDLLRELLNAVEGSGLAVSHDAIVMPYIFWATGDDFTERWLPPLDGVVLGMSGLWWQGEHFEVPA